MSVMDSIEEKYQKEIAALKAEVDRYRVWGQLMCWI